MKKVMFTLGIGLVTVLGTTGSVSASTTEDTTIDTTHIKLTDGGITPDSTFYGMDKFLEKVSLRLTFNDEKEAQKLLEIAEERLGELQNMNSEEAAEYANELYEEYGTRLEEANVKLAQLIAEGKIKDQDIKGLQDKLDYTSEADQAVDAERKEAIKTEIKEKVKDVITMSYAVTVATNLDAEQVTKLKEQGFGYGEILKLKAFSDMSSLTIEELTYLDIFEENEEGEMEVDFGKLADVLGVDKDEVKEQFKTYKDVIQETRNARNEKIKTKMDARRDEYRTNMNDKINSIVSEHKNQFLSKIDEAYNAKIAIINSLSIEDTKKAELINELDQIKIDLTEEITDQVENHELNPRDLGELNREITNKLNETLTNLDLTDEQIAEIREASQDLEIQTNHLVTEIVKRIEERTDTTIDQAIIDQIKANVLQKAMENTDEDTSNMLGNIQGELFDRIGNIVQNQPESNEGDQGNDDESTIGDSKTSTDR